MKPLLILVCLAGLLYQVYEISDLFFAYRTQTSVKIELQSNISIPSFSACFRAVDFLRSREFRAVDFLRSRESRTVDFLRSQKISSKGLRQNHGTNGHRSESMRSKSMRHDPDQIEVLPNDRVMDLLESTTVNEIFQYAPSSSILIKSCRLRRINSFSLMYYNDSPDCYQLFNVTSYVSREFVCYHIQQSHESIYDLWQVSFVPEYFNLLYSITLDHEKLRDVEFYTVYAHETDSSMLFDSALTPIFQRLKKGSIQTVQTTYRTVTNHRLPSPYDTNCIKSDNYKSWTEYAVECINNRTVERFGKFFFSGFIWNGSRMANSHLENPSHALGRRALNYPLLTGRNLLDPTVDHHLEIFKSQCFKPISVCTFKHTYSSLTLTDDFRMSIDMMLPRDPMVIINHYPRLSVIEYLLYILTCFGSWFGISIFGTSQVLNNLMKKFISDRNRCLKRYKSDDRNICRRYKSDDRNVCRRYKSDDRNVCRRYKSDDRNVCGKNRLKSSGSKEYVSPYLTVGRNHNRNSINFDNRHTIRSIRHNNNNNNRVGILNMNRYNQPHLKNYRMNMLIP